MFSDNDKNNNKRNTLFFKLFKNYGSTCTLFVYFSRKIWLFKIAYYLVSEIRI